MNSVGFGICLLGNRRQELQHLHCLSVYARQVGFTKDALEAKGPLA